MDQERFHIEFLLFLTFLELDCVLELELKPFNMLINTGDFMIYAICKNVCWLFSISVCCVLPITKLLETRGSRGTGTPKPEWYWTLNQNAYAGSEGLSESKHLLGNSDKPSRNAVVLSFRSISKDGELGNERRGLTTSPFSFLIFNWDLGFTIQQWGIGGRWKTGACIISCCSLTCKNNCLVLLTNNSWFRMFSGSFWWVSHFSKS